MSEHEVHILIAEDMEENRFALKRLLKKSEFKQQYTFANDGDEAWALLQEHPDKYTVALLDRMMPGMSGMDLLKLIKQDDRFKYMPVVFQTAMAQTNDVVEGFAAGAFYYITKPYPEREIFLSIIRSAVAESQNLTAIQAEIDKTSDALAMVNKLDLQFKNMEQLNLVASLISKTCPDPSRISLGISELLINAVEHGNLGITYDEKTRLNNDMCWMQEVKHRLDLPEYKDKQVSVRFERGNDEIRIIIIDEGAGFDWTEFEQMKPERAYDNHGRGIAMAGLTSFDRLEYKGTGSEVHAVINL